MEPPLALSELIPLGWEGYQRHFVTPDGRVVRPLNQHDTVSEGQAYALLLAVTLKDQVIFDHILNWTEHHLSRQERFGDSLHAWHWKVDQGIVDWNSATDAEVDFALALLLADRQWKQDSYRKLAMRMLQDIMDLETEVIGEHRYLLPGNWRLPSNSWVLNPSYFSPGHFQIFAFVTGDNRWQQLRASSYGTLEKLIRQPHGISVTGLAPDWVGIDSNETLFVLKDFSSDATWDAVRMPWRLALDVLLSRKTPTPPFLKKNVEFFRGEWKKRNGQFYLEYRLSGEPLKKEQQVAAYAMMLPALYSLQSPLSSHVLHKTATYFHRDDLYFQHPDDYYQNSLSLLGLISLPPSAHPDIPSLVQELQKMLASTPECCPQG